MSNSCTNMIAFCKIDEMGRCRYFDHNEDCPYFNQCPSHSKSPSIKKLIEIYQANVGGRREKTGQDICDREVRRSIALIHRLVESRGMSITDPTSKISRKVMYDFADDLKKSGLSPDTVLTYLRSVQRVTSMWMCNVCEDMGFELKRLPIPEIMNLNNHYTTPPIDILTSLRMWYNGLASKECTARLIYAMCMYHFGMRNGDVDLLKWNQFQIEMGRVVLTYTPHKTRLKSKRVVKIELCPVDWRLLRRFKDISKAGDDDFVIPGGGHHSGIRDNLNAQIRALGFNGNKGMYELRKACADEYARKEGVEMAKNILGHTIVTGATTHYVNSNVGIVPTIW